MLFVNKNNNALVFDTVDNALLRNPGAQPLFNSDREFQYTNRTFHTKIVVLGITQSMSRIAKCIDNGPMEGFGEFSKESDTMESDSLIEVLS